MTRLMTTGKLSVPLTYLWTFFFNCLFGLHISHGPLFLLLWFLFLFSGCLRSEGWGLSWIRTAWSLWKEPRWTTPMSWSAPRSWCSRIPRLITAAPVAARSLSSYDPTHQCYLFPSCNFFGYERPYKTYRCTLNINTLPPTTLLISMRWIKMKNLQRLWIVCVR